MKFLADTSALLALAWRDDRHHAAAKRFVHERPQARFLLTELILGEFATRLRARNDAERVARAVASILASRRYEVVVVDVEMLHGALDHLRRYGDKRLSFTDCTSFEVMQRLQLGAAFTFDRDFRDCGFTMVP